MKRLAICFAGVALAVTAFGQQPGTVSPANASVRPGDNVALTFTASGMSAYGELDVAIGNYNVVSDPRSGCYFYYYQGAVYLLNDSDGNSYSSVTLGTQQSASGGNCSVSGAGSSASLDGNGNLALILSMSFGSWMAGTDAYYEQAVDDQYGSSSGWWQIPDAFLAIGMLGPPQLGTVAPASGISPPNQGNTLTFTATDPNGAWGINEVDIMIGPPGATGWDGTSCYLWFNPYSGNAYLANQSPYWSPFLATNGSCSISSWSMQASGNTVTVTLGIQFSSSMVGTNNLSEDIWGWSGAGYNASTGWGVLGTFTVSGSPIITSSSFLSPGILAKPGYSTAVTVQGGNAPYAWSAQGLPPGLGINGTGTISGTPGVAGTFSPTVKVTDSLQHSATLAGSLTIVASDSTNTGPLSASVSMPKTEVGVFRNAASFLEDSNGNGNYDAGADRFIANFYSGGTSALGSAFVAGDIPVVGDWTGSGTAKVGIYRSSTGQWFLDFNDNGVYDSADPAPYGFGGMTGDKPFVGDWTGTGKDCVGIYRSVGSMWLADLNCNGTFDGTPYDAFFPFGGLQYDVPVVGKWNGTSMGTQVGVVRVYAPGGVPQGNPFFWVTDQNAANAGSAAFQAWSAQNPGNPNNPIDPTAPTYHPPGYCFGFGGLAGDAFVSGNWDGNSSGTSEAGVYRAGYWVLDAALPSATQTAHIPGLAFGYGGIAGDVPVTGHWAAPPAPAISTTSLPGSLVGNSYSQALAATGGTPPYHWSATAASMPPGLTIYDNGTVTGTPTAGGAYSVAVSLRDNAGVNASRNVSLTVQDFALGPATAVSVVQAGASTTVTIPTSSTTGLTGSLALSTVNNPGSATAPAITLQAPSGVSIGNSFTIAVSSPLGSSSPITSAYTVSLPVTAVYNASGQQITKTVLIPITVTPVPTFTLSTPSVNPVVIGSPYSGASVTFTQTVTGVNGFNGPVTIAPVQPVEQVNGSNQFGYTYATYPSGYLTLTYDSNTVTLSPAAPTATLTGHVTVSNWTPSNACICVLNYEVLAGGVTWTSGPANGGIQAIIGTLPPFTITGIPTNTAVYTSGAPTPVTVMINPINGSTPSPITFSLSNQGYTVATTVSQPSGTPAGASWPATFNISAGNGATSGFVQIVATGGGGSVPFSMAVTANPAFSISASPASQTTHSSGSVSYQISLSSGNGFAGPVSLSVSAPQGSPPLPSYTLSPNSPLGVPGTAVLTVQSPSVTTPTTYNLTLTGTSGSVSTSTALMLFANPPANGAAATMLWPVSNSIVPSSGNATFSWTKGVGVTGYQLFVGTQPGASDVYFGSIGAGTQTASVPSPRVGTQNVYVSLYSAITEEPTPIQDPGGERQCPVGGSGGGTTPTKATTPGPTYVLNGAPVSQQGALPGEVRYNYTLDAGDARNLTGCYSEITNDKLSVRLASVSPAQSSTPRQFQVGYSATDDVATGNRQIYCVWQNPSGLPTSVNVLLNDTGDPYSAVVYDATPVIKGVQQGTLVTGGSTNITISGQNFGSAGTLAFYTCAGGGSPCATSDIIFTQSSWDVEFITGSVSLSSNPSAVNYYVQVTSKGVSGTGQSFFAGGGGGQATQAQSQPAGPIGVTTASVTQGVKKISTQTQSVVVGQQISISSEVDYLPAGVSIRSQIWTFSSASGSYVGNFLQTDTGGPPSGSAPPPVVNGQDLTFYFVDGGSGIKVTYTATLTDMTQVTNYTLFDVARPTATGIMATSGPQGNIGVGPASINGNQYPWTLYYGLGTTSNYAMKFAAQYTEPAGYAGGKMQWVQTGQSVLATTRDGQTYVKTCSGLDTSYPYDTKNTTYDSPTIALSSGSEYKWTSSYTMWLMWSPPVTGTTIFVPLAKASWAWIGDAVSGDNGDTWGVGSAGVPAGVVSSVNAIDFPKWDTSMTTTSTCQVTTQ